MFEPNNSTITRNMHKVSLRNYATGLPHQREQKWQGHAHRPRPLCHKQVWLLLQIRPEFAPSVREKRNSNDLLAGICMKQAWGGAGDPVPAVLPGATLQPPCLHFAEGPPPTPIHPIFLAMPKRPILNGKFPRKLRQSWMTSFVIKGLT